jgi:ATP-dependent DNA helicase RecG
MNIDQLRQLVNKGESDHLEFKISTSQLKSGFETVCAFLNLKGGFVIFGVKNNGELIGQNVSDNTKQELANEIRKIEPNVFIDIHYLHLNNEKQIIVLEVPEGKHVPYTYDGRSFERTTSTTSRMTQHRLEQMIIQRNYLNHDWEEHLTDEFIIDDLDHQEIMNTIKEGINKNRISPEAIDYSVEQILDNFKLIKDGRLTNAAVVLFAKNPEKIFSRCEIKMARFRGRTKVEGFIDNQWERGNAFQLITLAHHFANRHLPIAGYFVPGKLQRIDEPAVPQLALREALINAICHKDYNLRSTTSLAIYDDRLELWNPGGLLPEINIEQLKGPHNSYPRNELIADVFYKRGWIEKWGTGTTRMIEYCRANNTPEPEFTDSSNGFSVTFSFKEAMNTGVSSEPTINLTLRQMEIVAVLKNAEELSLKEIKEQLPVSLAESTIRENLNHLKTKGIVTTRGQARLTKWLLINK